MNHLPPPASAHVDILTRAEHGRHTFVFVFFPPAFINEPRQIFPALP